MRRAWVLPGLAVVLLAAVLGSLCVGVYPVPALSVARILLAAAAGQGVEDLPGVGEAEWITVLVVRAPRVLLAAAAGAGLGLAGAALQGMMRNPLVGPDIVGISAGAAFGGGVAILNDLPGAETIACAMAGGLGALLLAWGLSRLGRGGGVLPLVLAGIVVAAFFSALNGLLQYVADPDSKLPAMVHWLIGSFAGASPARLALAGPAILGAGAVLILLRWRINLLSLGDVDAAALGVRAGALRWAVVALVALIVAAQVSVSGIVGWVGLVVPHAARMVVGPDHRRLMPASALAGAVFMLAMDDLARLLTAQELPIGILTAVVGTPVFAVLFWRLQTRGWGHG